MNNITEVYYEEIDPTICSMDEASEYYYHFNLIGVSDTFNNAYEECEKSQLLLKNRIIGDAAGRGDIPTHPNLNNTIFGISSIKNKAIVIAEC